MLTISESRARRPIFSMARRRRSFLSQTMSFIGGVTIVGFGTVVGYATINTIYGNQALIGPVLRTLRWLIAQVSVLDPVVTAVAAGVIGLVSLAFWVRGR